MTSPRQAGATPVGMTDNRSVGELFGDLTRDLGTLVRKELELARTEIKEEVAQAGKASGMLGAGAVAGWMALMMLSFALAFGLAEVMPTGFAFLLVGLAYAVGAVVLGARGRDELRRVRPVPEQTIETLRRTPNGPSSR